MSMPSPGTEEASAKASTLDAEAAKAIVEAEAAESRMLQTVRRSVDLGKGGEGIEGLERRSSGIVDGLPRSPLQLVESDGRRMSRAVGARRTSKLVREEGRSASVSGTRRSLPPQLPGETKGRRRTSIGNGEAMRGLAKEKRRCVIPKAEGGYGS